MRLGYDISFVGWNNLKCLAIYLVTMILWIVVVKASQFHSNFTLFYFYHDFLWHFESNSLNDSPISIDTKTWKTNKQIRIQPHSCWWLQWMPKVLMPVFFLWSWKLLPRERRANFGSIVFCLKNDRVSLIFTNEKVDNHLI